jgi:hypothetical protein
MLAVVLPGDEMPMPGEQGVRAHDRSDLTERSATQLLRLGGQPNALVVGEPETPRPELLSKDAILGLEIVDHVALLLVDPAGQRDEEKLQGCETGSIERSVSKRPRGVILMAEASDSQRVEADPIARSSFWTVRDPRTPDEFMT